MTSSDRDPVDVVAEEFAARLRGGEYPSVTEYVQQHPDLEDQLRAVLPGVAMLEQLAQQNKQESERPPSAMDDDSPAPEQIGDFRIVREIGRGGMGVVYEATEESLGRHVALKVLPTGVLTSAKQVRRFHREAQAAARLHHTNIVPVFGVGESDGLHYYVMQCIRGEGLDTWIEDQRTRGSSSRVEPSRSSNVEPADSVLEPNRTADLPPALTASQTSPSNETPQQSVPLTPSSVMGMTVLESGNSEPDALPATDGSSALPDLSGDSSDVAPLAPIPPAEAIPLSPEAWRKIADIGRQSADALDYAHQQGVLHRDIKPANLILDDHDIVWITDFGLAKLAEQDDLTNTGDIVGTLRYMSPEQFSGIVDYRTDIYALGLTLYELCTLKPAFDELDRNKLIRQVSQDSPVRPRSLNPSIPKDLETIILKAIARDPSHRYQRAGDLAHDLSAFMEDRPIAARRASSLERFWRWCRRDPLTAGLSGGIAALLVVVATMATIGYSEAIEQRDKIQVQSDRAEANLELALRAFDEMFEQLTTSPSGQLDNAFDEDRSEVPSIPAAVTDRDAVLLSNLLSFYELFADQNSKTPSLQKRIANATLRVGEIYLRLDDFENADDAFNKALKTADNLVYHAPDDKEIRLLQAKLHNNLGMVAERRGRADEALEQHSDALRILKKMDAEDGPTMHRFELARTYTFASISQFRQYNPQASTESLLNAERILHGLRGDNPDVAQFEYLMAKAYSGLFQNYMQLRKEGEAFKSKDKATQILETLVENHPDVPEYNFELSLMLSLTPPIAFSEEARTQLMDSVKRSRDLAIGLAKAYPDQPRYAALKGRVSQRLAFMLFESGSFADAESPLRASIKIQKELVDDYPERSEFRVLLADAHGRLGDYLREQDDLKGSLGELEQSISILNKVGSQDRKFGFTNRVLARNYESLATTYDALNEPDKAAESRAEASRFEDKRMQRPSDFMRPFSRGRDGMRGPNRGGANRGGPGRGGQSRGFGPDHEPGRGGQPDGPSHGGGRRPGEDSGAPDGRRRDDQGRGFQPGIGGRGPNRGTNRPPDPAGSRTPQN